MHCRLIVSEHARRLSFTDDTRALLTDGFELTQLNLSMCECSQPIWPRERRVAQGRLARSVRNTQKLNKTVFDAFFFFYLIKNDHLPRQALDKHTTNIRLE
jgi:hypothetical protein